MIENEPTQQQHHYGLLAIFLALAVVGWCLWLNYGAAFTHSALASQVQSSKAASTAHSAPSALAATGTDSASTAAPASASATSATAVSAALAPKAETAERATWFTELGQTGDAFGSFNALLTAIAGALVAWAGYLQHQSLREARIALCHAQAGANEERRHRQRQEFESLFFQLLQLTVNAAEQIEGPRKLKAVGALTPGKGNTKEYWPGKMGNSGINEFAGKVFRKASASPASASNEALLQGLVRVYATDVFDTRPSQFGTYFRLLYQTFQHVADSPLESEAVKVRYANIARSQLPEGAVLLLALNGLTEEGHKFASLIERFGLLEHMHRRYRDAFFDALLIGYRERAFLGSSVRSEPGHKWIELPKLGATHFTSAMHARKDDDEEEDMGLGLHDEIDEEIVEFRQ